jgi:hypothetical protein
MASRDIHTEIPRIDRVRASKALGLPPEFHGTAAGRGLQDYFDAIVLHLEREELSEALSSSAALPRICSALEHPRFTSSIVHCICWCDAWVASEGDGTNIYPLTRVYVDHEREALSEWIRSDAHFTRSVARSLLSAARTWYTKRGASDPTVQLNLGKLAAVSALGIEEH